MFNSQVFNKKKKVYQRVFETDDGKAVLADLYKFCKIDQPRHVRGDSHETAFNEGMARVAYRIKSILEQDSTEITNLMHEQALSLKEQI